MATPHGAKFEDTCKVRGSPHCAEISVHTLNGHIRLHLPERVVDLPAGNLLALDQCVSHDVEASEDSAFLLTLSWPPETKIVEEKPCEKEATRAKRK